MAEHINQLIIVHFLFRNDILKRKELLQRQMLHIMIADDNQVRPDAEARQILQQLLVAQFRLELSELHMRILLLEHFYQYGKCFSDIRGIVGANDVNHVGLMLGDVQILGNHSPPADHLDQKALICEQLQCLAQGVSADVVELAQFFLGKQKLAGLQEAGQDLHPQNPCHFNISKFFVIQPYPSNLGESNSILENHYNMPEKIMVQV
ncbi:hypothetical protein D3C71_1345850 [compost metagenome]